MKNKLVLIGLSSAGVASILAIVGVNTIGTTDASFLQGSRLCTTALFIGLFSIMTFIAAKLWKET